jgi:methoxymalonate biosynthesis acyl carrier protein
MTAHIEKQIFEFIGQRFPSVELAPDDDIFALGFVNSLFAMELVMFIESTFKFSIPNELLKLENFRSVGSMTKLVSQQIAMLETGSDRG